MSTNQKSNRNQRQTADEKLMEGLKKHQQAIPSLLIGGKSVKPADIIVVLQNRIHAADAVIPAKATWQAAVKAERDERAQSKALVSAVRQALQLAFAGSIDVLADFGLKPRKTPTRSPEDKVAAAAKAQATRAARHTMGRKQKARITGTVAPPAAPATSPASPSHDVPVPTAAPTTAPAPSPAPAQPTTPAQPAPRTP